jgi:hypothetical protein
MPLDGSGLALAAIRLVDQEHPEATTDLIADDYDAFTRNSYSPIPLSVWFLIPPWCVDQSH